MVNWLSLIPRLICTMVLLVAPLPSDPLPAADCGEVDGPFRDYLSPLEEQSIWAKIHSNIQMLRRERDENALNAAQAVTYAFPLHMIPGLPDYAGYVIGAFADHDPASGSIRDYNGGARTYDGHQGTDFGLYPYKWNKVNAGEMQVVAAAAGMIVTKDNLTAADHNCSNPGNAGGGNLIALEHADGRVTFYAHMRYNSLTSKSIGQTVAQGEYLGLVASSGNSNGPHLHFEVRVAKDSMQWIDPFAGPYSQPESLWTSQRPYWDSTVNRLVTRSSIPTFDNCAPEAVTNQDSFSLPGTIYFYTFFRDYQPTLPLVLNIYRPDGTLRRTWAFTPADNTNYPAMWLKWTGDWFANVPNTELAGTWRFAVSYAGQTYETFFNVNAPPVLAVTSPNGGEQWDPLLGHSLTWSDNIGGAVNIALYQNGAFVADLVSNTPSDGDYLWVPGPTLTPGAGYTIRVTSVINPALVDQSNAPFTLLPTALTHPVRLPYTRR